MSKITKLISIITTAQTLRSLQEIGTRTAGVALVAIVGAEGAFIASGLAKDTDRHGASLLGKICVELGLFFLAAYIILSLPSIIRIFFGSPFEKAILTPGIFGDLKRLATKQALAQASDTQEIEIVVTAFGFVIFLIACGSAFYTLGVLPMLWQK